jgi:hypothetical protein
MKDEQIEAIALNFLEWTEQGFSVIDRVGFARALLADGGKGEAVLKLEGELAVAMSIIEAMRSELNAPQAECAPREAQPDGWKLVPVEPTPDMMRAVRHLDYTSPTDVDWDEGYRVMLAAAPTPERADAVKDAALTDEAILDEFERRAMKLRDFMGYPNPDGVRVIEGVRAILAANKER